MTQPLRLVTPIHQGVPLETRLDSIEAQIATVWTLWKRRKNLSAKEIEQLETMMDKTVDAWHEKKRTWKTAVARTR
jgi:DNA phosphorothioation-dependent restriction protein DptG